MIQKMKKFQLKNRKAKKTETRKQKKTQRTTSMAVAIHSQLTRIQEEGKAMMEMMIRAKRFLRIWTNLPIEQNKKRSKRRRRTRNRRRAWLSMHTVRHSRSKLNTSTKKLEFSKSLWMTMTLLLTNSSTRLNLHLMRRSRMKSSNRKGQRKENLKSFSKMSKI